MSGKRSLTILILFVGLLFVGPAVDISALAAEPLIALDAEKLPEGALASWENGGTLKGVFKNDGTDPKVAVVDGVKAVVFGEKDHMTADVTAPAGITGDKPWTCLIKTNCSVLSGERTLFSWSTRPSNCLELEYGDSPMYGAVGTWNDPNVLGWDKGTPTPNKWHLLAYRYTGGQNGDLEAWCDGELRGAKKATLSTKDGKPFVLGGTIAEAGENRVNYVHPISGAIASVRVYDHAFSPVEIWNAAGMEGAFPVSPERNAVLDDLTTTLKWLPGNDKVASYNVYFGTNKEAVENGNEKLPVGKPEDIEKVYKGNQPATKTEFGPLSSALGTTYYWRIDQLDKSGKVAQKGAVLSFSTESGNAAEPVPADQYICVEGGKRVLSWKPGKYAVKQNIYIGDNEKDVQNKKTPDVPDLPATTASIDLPLEKPVLGKTYYWRVESINRDKLSPSKGEVWSFRTVGKKLKVYLSGGQSNAVGCSSVNGIPENLKGFQKGVICFVRGECRLGEYGWAYLRDGLGAGFGDYDGRGTFGPELTFGANMAPTKPEEVIAVLKCAWGGTNLGQQWRPPSAGGQTGNLYEGFVKAVREGMAALDPAFEPEFAGMIWMQGESDTGDRQMADDYAKNLTCLINDIRAETKKPDLPFVFAKIKTAPAWDNPPARGSQIRAAQDEVAKTVPNTATFGTDDYGMCDPWHYDTPGMLSLGERFAAAMKKIEANMSSK